MNAFHKMQMLGVNTYLNTHTTLVLCGINFLNFVVCVCVNSDDRAWMCTFCVFRNYYWDQLEREAAMSRQISQHMLVSILCDSLSLGLKVSLSHCHHSSSLLSYINSSASISSCICTVLMSTKHLLQTQASM